MSERLRGISLSEYKKICIRNLRRQSGLVIESGSSSIAIVNDLVENYRIDLEKAVKMVQGVGKESGV